MNSIFLKKDYNERLINAVDKISSTSNKVKLETIKRLMIWKASKRPAINKTQQRLYYISIQNIKDSLLVELSVKLLNDAMVKFVRWFGYIMSRRLTLCSTTLNRFRRDYPYKKRGVGRMCNVLFIPRKNEYEYVKRMYKRNMENLKI